MGEEGRTHVIVGVDLRAVQRESRAQHEVVDRSCAVPLTQPEHELRDRHDVVDVVAATREDG